METIRNGALCNDYDFSSVVRFSQALFVAILILAAPLKARSLEPQSDRSAWFLKVGNQEKLVSYCVQSRFDDGTPEQLFKPTTHSWIKFYIKNLLIRWQKLTEQHLQIAEKNEPMIAASFSYQESCSESTDLRFYIGIENEKTSRTKELYEDPLAFSYQEQYDEQAGWSKGFIWLDASQFKLSTNFNDETRKDWVRFRGILAHEIGHVFGLEHIDNTIMRADIADVDIYELFYPKIDRKDHLVSNNLSSMRDALMIEQNLFLSKNTRRYEFSDLSLVPEVNQNEVFKDLTDMTLKGQLILGLTNDIRLPIRHDFWRQSIFYESPQKDKSDLLSMWELTFFDYGEDCQEARKDFLSPHPITRLKSLLLTLFGFHYSLVCGMGGLEIFLNDVFTDLPVSNAKIFKRKFRGREYYNFVHFQTRSGFIISISEKKIPITLSINNFDFIEIYYQKDNLFKLLFRGTTRNKEVPNSEIR